MKETAVMQLEYTKFIFEMITTICSMQKIKKQEHKTWKKVILNSNRVDIKS